MIQILVNVLKQMFSIVVVIIMVLFIVLTLGLGFILLDSIDDKENYEYNDWTLMEDWKEIEIKRLKKEKKNGNEKSS